MNLGSEISYLKESSVRPSKAALIGVAALAASSALYAGPATASLKEVIILQTLDVGTPPLIDLYREERLRMAPVEEKPTRAERATGRQ